MTGRRERAVVGMRLGAALVAELAGLAFTVTVLSSPGGQQSATTDPLDRAGHVAGWVTIAIAVVGLIASLFVTGAYCRYGCPTGAMLKFLRFSAASDRLGRRDYVAAAFVLIALGMGLWR